MWAKAVRFLVSGALFHSGTLIAFHCKIERHSYDKRREFGPNDLAPNSIVQSLIQRANGVAIHGNQGAFCELLS
jgi:hypothetical protein